MVVVVGQPDQQSRVSSSLTVRSNDPNNRKRTHESALSGVSQLKGGWSSDDDDSCPQGERLGVLQHLLRNGFKHLGRHNRMDMQKSPSWGCGEHDDLISRALSEGLDGVTALGRVSTEWLMEQQQMYMKNSMAKQTTPVSSFLVRASKKNAGYCKRTHISLLELRHAGGCNGCQPGGKVCRISNCQTARELWTHLLSCSKSFCAYPSCLFASWALCHLRGCKQDLCPICGPVKAFIAKSRAAEAGPKDCFLQYSSPAEYLFHSSTRLGIHAVPDPVYGDVSVPRLDFTTLHQISDRPSTTVLATDITDELRAPSQESISEDSAVDDLANRMRAMAVLREGASREDEDQELAKALSLMKIDPPVPSRAPTSSTSGSTTPCGGDCRESDSALGPGAPSGDGLAAETICAEKACGQKGQRRADVDGSNIAFLPWNGPAHVEDKVAKRHTKRYKRRAIPRHQGLENSSGSFSSMTSVDVNRCGSELDGPMAFEREPAAFLGNGDERDSRRFCSPCVTPPLKGDENQSLALWDNAMEVMSDEDARQATEQEEEQEEDLEEDLEEARLGNASASRRGEAIRTNISIKSDTILEQQQMLLVLLYHVCSCTASSEDGGDECGVTKHCASLKLLWHHVLDCAQAECQTMLCCSTTSMVLHARECATRHCFICAPMRAMQRRDGDKLWAWTRRKPARFRDVSPAATCEVESESSDDCMSDDGSFTDDSVTPFRKDRSRSEDSAPFL